MNIQQFIKEFNQQFSNLPYSKDRQFMNVEGSENLNMLVNLLVRNCFKDEYYLEADSWPSSTLRAATENNKLRVFSLGQTLKFPDIKNTFGRLGTYFHNSQTNPGSFMFCIKNILESEKLSDQSLIVINAPMDENIMWCLTKPGFRLLYLIGQPARLRVPNHGEWQGWNKGVTILSYSGE